MMSAGRRCIINVATDSYKKGQERLENSLKKVNYTDQYILWENTYPPNSPTHQQVPYGFKTYAFLEAQRQGYDVVLWLDASMWAVKNPTPVFEHIEEHGYMIEAAGQWLGWWSTDAFLSHHGLTRDEAMKIPMFSAGFTGLDLRNSRSLEFLNKWHETAQDGISFIGPWKDSGPDPNYKGHRHDMSAASLIAHKMGMKMRDPTFMVYGAYLKGPPAADVCFLCRGIC